MVALAVGIATPPLQSQITTVKGFRVDLLYKVPDAAGSWVSLCVDPRGRLIASDQYGPLYRITLPAPTSTDAPQVAPLPLAVGSAQGLAFVGETLYAVVAEKVHGGPGLYRVRDTNGDGELDDVAKLAALEGTGEHGPHAVVPAPDGRSLHVVAGNATRLPPLARAAARPNWIDRHAVPPVPAVVGSETRGIPPGGWVCRTDLEGREWTLLSAGFRNHYDLAINSEGELFTFDSDTEFDVNLPWYRPTRVLHVVSGADFGWRPGGAKIPVEAPETLPPVVTLGLGSPTGLTFGYGSAFPERYAAALFVADWSYGKLTAVHLRPDGSSYRGEPEEIVRGLPLPITDVVINSHDGALYFITGGRRLQSALYRLTWIGASDLERATQASPKPSDKRSSERQARHDLERFHGVNDSAAVDAAWRHLGSGDRFLRTAALRALESQRVAAWRTRALAETDACAGLLALLALIREGDDNDVRLAREAAARWPLRELPRDLQIEKCRLLVSAIARRGVPDAERVRLLDECDPLHPSSDAALTAALGELLVALGAPRIIERVLEQLVAAPTREAQIMHASLLRQVRTGWTIPARTTFLRWLDQAQSFRGGAAFRPTIQLIRKDALATLSDVERAALAEILREPGGAAASTPSDAFLAGRPTTAWTLDALWPRVERALTTPRDLARGRRLAAATGCFACHTMAGEGGALGPDLSGAGGRFSARDLLEAITDPSKVINDQYGTVVVTLTDGTQQHGRLVNQTPTQLHLAANLFDPMELLKIEHARVKEIAPSAISLMPAGLLGRLQPDEIADLVAFVLGHTR